MAFIAHWNIQVTDRITNSSSLFKELNPTNAQHSRIAFPTRSTIMTNEYTHEADILVDVVRGGFDLKQCISCC